MAKAYEDGYRYRFGRWLGFVWVRYSWVKQGRMKQECPIRLLDALFNAHKVRRWLDAHRHI